MLKSALSSTSHTRQQRRAWSRQEILQYLEKAGFKLLEQGDNFDETSFYNLAKKI